jgi:hypothetical protein
VSPDRILVVIAASVLVFALLVWAEPPDIPASAPARGEDVLAHARMLLQDVRDNVFSFDDEAFYEFCRYVRHHAPPAVSPIEASEPAVPWKFMLERPSDYRGRLVTIEGVLQARTAFEVSGPGREGIGTLYQCELSDRGTRSLCAAITVDDPQDIPIRSRVRAKGFFIKVRGYVTNAGDAGAGPLLVARRLELIEAPSSALPDLFSGWAIGLTEVCAVTAVLALVWLALRRAVRRTRPPSIPVRGGSHPGHTGGRRADHAGLPSQQVAGASSAEGDYDWLTKMPESETREQCDGTPESTGTGDPSADASDAQG